MDLQIGDSIISLLSGDTVVTKEGTYLIVSADGFDLRDESNKAQYILINVKHGSMEGYAHDLNEIWKYYHIIEVIPNYDSFERRK